MNIIYIYILLWNFFLYIHIIVTESTRMCKFYSLNFVIIFQLARFSIGIYFWIVKLNKIQLCIYVSYLKIETFVNKKI